jgi:alkylation response protein AidB-like acyl-CoA dehydrogenase
MDLDLGDDQTALRDGIAALLAGRFDSDRVRSGFDRAVYDELGSAGVFALRTDGFEWADAVVVFEQLGRHCVPGPLVACLLAGAGTAGIVERADPVWVEDLDQLDALYVLDGDAVMLVEPRALTADPSPWPLDPLTPVARVDGLPRGVATDFDGSEWRRAGAVLTAAFQLGLADRCTELAVAYAKERVQFERPIASFQAIKHICADMLTRTEVARAAVYAAGAHLDTPDPVADGAGLERSVATAKVLAGEAAIANGKAATQVHGGMGFTWEVDVHLYLKRAWVLETQFGSGDHHADAIAASLPGS